MENYNKLWRTFFAVSLVAIAVQQIVLGTFVGVIMPVQPNFLVVCTTCVWVVSFLLIGLCGAIFADKLARVSALCLGWLLLLIFLAFHLPFEIQNSLHFLGAWTNPLKLLAFSGGAFVTAASLPENGKLTRIIKVLESGLPAGRFFFAITMVVFGVEHFVYPGFVATLVPGWIPGHLFWTYFAGVALIAAGLAIMLNIRLRQAATLLGLMIFLWLITLHIPRAIADPHTGSGNELTSIFEALGFSAIAFLIAAVYGKNEVN